MHCTHLSHRLHAPPTPALHCTAATPCGHGPWPCQVSCQLAVPVHGPSICMCRVIESFRPLGLQISFVASLECVTQWVLPMPWLNKPATSQLLARRLLRQLAGAVHEKSLGAQPV